MHGFGRPARTTLSANGRVEYGLGVVARRGADHRSGPDIPGSQVKEGTV